MMLQPQFFTHTGHSINTLNGAQSSGWKEYNNGIHDVKLSFSFLNTSDSPHRLNISPACPLFQFSLHNKTRMPACIIYLCAPLTIYSWKICFQ
jgi:hypothetical protein